MSHSQRLHPQPRRLFTLETLLLTVEAAAAALASARPAKHRRRIWKRPSERPSSIFACCGRQGAACVVHRPSLTFDPTECAAEITIRATKGPVDITEVDWGSEGPRVGNGALVPRLLHLGIVTLRSVGVRLSRNKPWNDRLRSLYSAMGFRDGEELDLDDLDAVAKAFDYIERAYGRFGLSVADP